MFVDDSNIWIAAKELVSKTKKYKTGEDHRVRIDMGKLADVLADGRQVHSATLYGSEPPPIDTVWEKAQQNGWVVDRKGRSSITGKEKQVDTQLAVDITKTALKTPVEKRGSIIIVTGDADVIPALNEVVQEKVWNVEVYMWRHALSSKIHDYARMYDRVIVKHLDDYLENITFTNMKFQIPNQEVVCEYGVMFSMKPNVFPKRMPTDWWIKQVESIAQWPFQYFWYDLQQMEASNTLVLVFKPDRVAGKFNRQSFLEDIRNHDIHSDYVNEAKAFQKDDPSAEFERIGSWNEDDLDNGYQYGYLFTSDSAESIEGEYNEESSSESCLYGKNCRYGLDCDFFHTGEEQDYFRARGGRGNPYRKVKPCKYVRDQGVCRKTREECDGAHGEEDAFCLACQHTGHYTNNCPCKESVPVY
jgi:uncharacterized LabA/DUF88 family protein